jgi:hypothetical protein
MTRPAGLLGAVAPGVLPLIHHIPVAHRYAAATLSHFVPNKMVATLVPPVRRPAPRTCGAALRAFQSVVLTDWSNVLTGTFRLERNVTAQLPRRGMSHGCDMLAKRDAL